jgi:hypothetical protein
VLSRVSTRQCELASSLLVHRSIVEKLPLLVLRAMLGNESANPVPNGPLRPPEL